MDDSSKTPLLSNYQAQDTDFQSILEEGVLQKTENELNSEKNEISNRMFKRKYDVITQEVREEFIKKVLSREVTIKEAAKEFGLKFSTSKAILHTYKKEGRIGKKKSRERKPRVSNAISNANEDSYNQDSVPVFTNSQIQEISLVISDPNLTKINEPRSLILGQPSSLIDTQRAQVQRHLMALDLQSQGQIFSQPQPDMSLAIPVLHSQINPQLLPSPVFQKMQLDNLLKESYYYQQVLRLQNEQRLLNNKALLQDLEMRSRLNSGMGTLVSGNFLSVSPFRSCLGIEQLNVSSIIKPLSTTGQVSDATFLQGYGLSGSYPTKRVFY